MKASDWEIEYDEDGVPVRMWWVSDAPVSLCPFDHAHCFAPDCECDCHNQPERAWQTMAGDGAARWAAQQDGDG